MPEKDYPPCPSRRRIVEFKADGTKAYNQRCTEQTAPKANLDVLPTDCLECPVRASLLDESHKPATGVPKRMASGLKPDTANSDYLPCLDRKVVDVKSCCGGVTQMRVCDSDLCHYYQGVVTPEICASCPVRKTSG